MKKGKCPKCESDDILLVSKRYPEPRGVIGVTLWSKVSVDDYVCESCGFRETYLHDMEDLGRIRKGASTAGKESARHPIKRT